jgi:predicted kinase
METPYTIEVPDLPTVYLLCGIACSGKTTYARTELEPQGVVRLSIDDGVSESYGTPGVDFDIEEYAAIERCVLDWQREELIGYLAVGTSVALDYGFKWRTQREVYRNIAAQQGVDCRLLYFKAGRDLLLQRAAVRNLNPDVNAVPVTPDLLDMFISWFEEPEGEGEIIVKQS